MRTYIIGVGSMVRFGNKNARLKQIKEEPGVGS